MIHQFRYSPRHRRPLISGSVLANGFRSDFVGVVDSGADDCIFPISFAHCLGIDPLADEFHQFRGASGNGSLFFREVTLEFNFGSFRARVGFTAARAASDLVLLGQNGFFDYSRVTLDRRARVFTIEPY